MVGNMDNSIKFYTEVLGLKLRNRIENEWAEVETEGLIIGLHGASHNHIKTPNQGTMSIGFTVGDLDKEVKHFENKGIKFKAHNHDGQVKLAHFEDLDKNPLYLCQVNF